MLPHIVMSMEPRAKVLTPTVKLWNGVEMPRVGLGTFRAHGEDVCAAVKAALRCGIRAFDTASIYKNEGEIGKVLKESGIPRDQLFITSKISPYQQGGERALQACHETLEKLGLDYVDLMLVHWPGVSKTPLGSPLNAQLRLESWRVLEELYGAGQFRAIGVSNYETQHLQELSMAATVKPMVNQIECHPRYQQAANRKLCAELGVAVVAYASLGQGELLKEPAVQQVAETHGITASQVLLRWGLEKGCCVIPKSVDPMRIKDFAATSLLSSWDLDERETELLDSLGSNSKKFCWDPKDVA